MGPIYWDTLTWEAFAGLLTVFVGAGAIFGAYRVGMKQGQSKKQIAEEAQRFLGPRLMLNDVNVLTRSLGGSGSGVLNSCARDVNQRL